MPEVSQEDREGLLTVTEAAQYLGISAKNVRMLIQAGHLHPIDLSTKGDRAIRKTYRFRKSGLDAFIRHRTVKRPDVAA